jgi:hypothetical protein
MVYGGGRGRVRRGNGPGIESGFLLALYSRRPSYVGMDDLFKTETETKT